MKSRSVQGPGANREAIRAFAEGYCKDVQRGSGEVANAEARSDLDAAALNDDSEIGRANALSERIYSQDVADAALVQEWQDALLNARNPMAARALAHFATDEAGPIRAVIGDDSLGNWPTERGAAISEAVGAIIACQNGPMCAPGTAYTMIACMERGNCAVGATLMDVRRDSISPQDWRSAELIVARLHARRRGP